MRELAELIVEMTGSRSEIVYEPAPVDDPFRRMPDITKARRHLDWDPVVGLEQGLKMTVEYFDALLRGATTCR